MGDGGRNEEGKPLFVEGSWVPETRNWELGTRNYDGPQDAQGGGVRILTFPY
jgi:hypothetical protein